MAAFRTRQSVILTVAVTIAVATIGGIWLSGHRKGPDQAGPSTIVGSQACRKCHEDKWQSLQTTGHARTLWPTADFPQRAHFDDAEFSDPEREHGYRYQLTDDGIRVSLPGESEDESFHLQYAFGSGEHAVTFMSLITEAGAESAVVDGTTVTDSEVIGVEHRASWFAHSEELGLTPGHQGLGVFDTTEAFGRKTEGEVLHRCFGCHATELTVRDGQLVDIPHPNVECEACHGPGSRHIAAVNDGSGVGLLKFSPGRGAHAEVALCAECHRSISDLPEEEITRTNRKLVRFQPVGLVRSRCFLESDDLACSTCHNPHEHASRQSQSEYEQHCIDCHTPQTDATECPVSPQSNCIECHMPPVELLPGIKFHDHWIRVRTAADPSGSAPAIPTTTVRPPSDTSAGNHSGIRFDDVTASTGIEFEHHSPLTEERHLHLVMGSGLAWLDFDADGWPDLYCGQGRPFKDTSSPLRSDQLFRNNDGVQFYNVTDKAGLHDVDYTMGLAVGDFDNDGFSDVFVSHYGRNRLYQNNGDGTFTDVSAELPAGGDDRFGAGNSWVDLDGDGNLDLFATGYLRLPPDDYRLCYQTYEGRKFPLSCQPREVPAEADAVFVNAGDGSFHDGTTAFGVNERPAHQGLGIAVADFDGDRNTDVYVANDSVANQLWLNFGKGPLQEQGLASGTALNRSGRREAGMGVSVGDIDGDGSFDLFVTNYFGETNTLYRNEGGGLFTDVTNEFGLAAPSRARLAFGTSILDADGDGWLDLFVANGHVHDRLEEIDRNEPFAQLPQFFVNQRGRRMSDVSPSAGTYFSRNVVGRGSAVADFDRDTRPDLAILHLNGPISLLGNETDCGNILTIDLIGTSCNRSAIGAVVEIEAGGRRMVHLQRGSASYLSCDEHRLLIGIGTATIADRVTVYWPGGGFEVWNTLRPGTTHVLIEGAGHSHPL